MQSRQLPNNKWTILDIINWTNDFFKSRNIDSPRASAELLLAHILNVRRIDLYLRYDQPLTKNELAGYKSLIKRRARREPLAYITQKREFWSMDLLVCPETLIPRPETECVVEKALSFLPESISFEEKGDTFRILELGVGSGAITLAIAKEKPFCLFFASDISFKAVKIAEQNAKNHGLENSIFFFISDWMKGLKNLPYFDMIVSNPPYIQSKTISSLQPEIYQYEPQIALNGGQDGLGCLRRIINNAYGYMKKEGVLILETGHDQKDGIKKIIDDCGEYKDVVFSKDYGGHDRVVTMRKK